MYMLFPNSPFALQAKYITYYTLQPLGIHIHCTECAGLHFSGQYFAFYLSLQEFTNCLEGTQGDKFKQVQIYMNQKHLTKF